MADMLQQSPDNTQAREAEQLLAECERRSDAFLRYVASLRSNRAALRALHGPRKELTRAEDRGSVVVT